MDSVLSSVGGSVVREDGDSHTNETRDDRGDASEDESNAGTEISPAINSELRNQYGESLLVTLRRTAIKAQKTATILYS